MAIAAKELVVDDVPACKRLKEATLVRHQQLHQTPLLAALEREDLDLDGYIRVMQVFHDFYAEFDQPIVDALPSLGGLTDPLDYTPRAPMFASDLQAMGVVPSGPRPAAPTPVRIIGPSRLAGVLYVVEGSMLGGAALNRCARRILQADDVKGRFYWQWCRDNAGSRWHAVRRAVEDIWLKDGRGADMIEAAAEVFDVLLARFEQVAEEKPAHIRFSK